MSHNKNGVLFPKSGDCVIHFINVLPTCHLESCRAGPAPHLLVVLGGWALVCCAVMWVRGKVAGVEGAHKGTGR